MVVLKLVLPEDVKSVELTVSAGAVTRWLSQQVPMIPPPRASAGTLCGSQQTMHRGYATQDVLRLYICASAEHYCIQCIRRKIPVTFLSLGPDGDVDHVSSDLS